MNSDKRKTTLTKCYDIGLVCVLNKNIGNNLTNFALYRVLSDMGYSILVIGNAVPECVALAADVRFDRFLQLPYESEDILEMCTDKTELIACNEICSMFCVGSDQIWRNMFVTNHDFYTCLDWVKSYKKKVSYGTSFGTDRFEGDDLVSRKMSYLLRRFQRISVREESGADILKKHFCCEAEVVLDPVFLCDEKYYYEMAQRGADRGVKGQYIGAYVLDISPVKEQAILSLSGRYTDNKYQVITDYREPLQESFTIEWLKSPAVEEWLYMIRNCEFFITDSFHGVCFAIIFEKPFAVIFDSKNWRGYTRLEHILKKFHLEERLMHTFDEDKLNSMYETPIDYSVIKAVLGKEKGRCMNWLASAICTDNTMSSQYCEWDEMLDWQFKNYIKMRKIELEIKKNNERVINNLRKVRSELFLSEHKKIDGMESTEGDSMQVVAFGAGDCFKRNITRIREVYDLKYVCDNNPMKWNQELEEGIVCISPQILSQMQDVLVVITVDSITVAFDIVRDLQRLGISNYTHVTNWMKCINV